MAQPSFIQGKASRTVDGEYVRCSRTERTRLHIITCVSAITRMLAARRWQLMYNVVRRVQCNSRPHCSPTHAWDVPTTSRIIPKCSIYGRFEIGQHSRIDDFTLASGNITIGNYVHVASHCSMMGDVICGDFSGISSGVRVYAKSDDFSGKYLAGPTIPRHMTNVTSRRVSIGKYALIGSGAMIFPGVNVGEGAVVGAGSLVRKDVQPWTVVVGNGKVIAKRSQEMRFLSAELERECEFRVGANYFDHARNPDSV